MKSDWQITFSETFKSVTGGLVEVFKVRDKNDTSHTALLDEADVWWNGRTARCTHCSSITKGMSASCKHAKAVKRMKAKAT
jgi:hypothetical protein